MDLLETKPYKISRKHYIVEAALEYLIAILVSGSFLARLTSELGFSDGTTGILSSVISLGCLFQLLSVFIRGRRMKPFVIVFNILNQLLFTLLYLVPFINVSQETKQIIFVVFIIMAYFVYNVAIPKQTVWLMSLVDDRNRGRFTANKEMVSLAVGIVFSFGMGQLVDAYQEKGQAKEAFLISAVVILVLVVLHTLTLIFSVEKPSSEEKKSVSLLVGLKNVFTNKAVLMVAGLMVLYKFSRYSTISFYGTYQIKELGFSQTMVVILSSLGSLVRIVVSRPIGRYADRYSFAKMMRFCLFFLLAAYLSAMLSTPATGKVFFTLYHILDAIAMGGVNSAVINLMFDYVPREKRADSLAISQTLSGVAGFLAALAVGPMVNAIQQNGNRFLGLPLYAQQVTSAVSAVLTLGCILYLTFGFIKRQNKWD